jgi:aminoglycoside/choline kinase family phosphotransferase
MTWYPPVPREAVDQAGRRWLVGRAWPERMPGRYVLEVLAPEQPGVRAAHLQHGLFELVPDGGDVLLPALTSAARLGDVLVHRAHKRAVVRTDDHRYIKVFRALRAPAAAERIGWMNTLLAASGFRIPAILHATTDSIVFDALPGRSLCELGQDRATISDEAFNRLWLAWSRAWAEWVSGQGGTASEHRALTALPLHDAHSEADNAWHWVDLWMRQSGNVPAAGAQREALLRRARSVTESLLRSPPDPLVAAHGDLHDKQILAVPGAAQVGLLDFDMAGRAEAALDLANLDVHLELRLRQQVLTDRRYLAAHSNVMAAAAELGVSALRFRAYADATRLRLACLYAFRPRWAALASGFLHERVPECLGGSGLTPGPGAAAPD